MKYAHYDFTKFQLKPIEQHWSAIQTNVDLFKKAEIKQEFFLNEMKNSVVASEYKNKSNFFIVKALIEILFLAKE